MRRAGRHGRSARRATTSRSPTGSSGPPRRRGRTRRRASAAAECASRRKISDSGTTHIVVVLARIAVRPAGTQATASWANAKYSPSWQTPTATSAGRSSRCGTRSRPRTARMAAIVAPDSTARPSANHSGVLPRLRAILVSGHALLSRITDTASWMKPAAALSYRHRTRRQLRASTTQQNATSETHDLLPHRPLPSHRTDRRCRHHILDRRRRALRLLRRRRWRGADAASHRSAAWATWARAAALRLFGAGDVGCTGRLNAARALAAARRAGCRRQHSRVQRRARQAGDERGACAGRLRDRQYPGERA